MVKEASTEAEPPPDKSGMWARAMRCCVCEWMMKVTNQDMLKAAKAGDVDMLKSCVECGAWMDFTMPDDDQKNTALHLAVEYCTDHTEYLAEAERLGLKVDPEKGCDGESKLKPKSREAKKQLQEDINAWQDKHDNDIACIEALCAGNADPSHLNGEGKTALDLARTKDPKIIKALEAQVEYLENLAKQAEEEAE